MGLEQTFPFFFIALVASFFIWFHIYLLCEKQYVKGLFTLSNSQGPDFSREYFRDLGTAAEQSGLTHCGLFVQVPGKEPGRSYLSFWLDPSRDVLVRISSAKLMLLPAMKRTTVMSQFQNGQVLVTQNGTRETDLSGSWKIKSLRKAGLPELLEHHRKRLNSADKPLVSFSSDGILKDYESLMQAKYCRMDKMGLIQFTDPDQSAYCYTWRGVRRELASIFIGGHVQVHADNNGRCKPPVFADGRSKQFIRKMIVNVATLGMLGMLLGTTYLGVAFFVKIAAGVRNLGPQFAMLVTASIATLFVWATVLDKVKRSKLRKTLKITLILGLLLWAISLVPLTQTRIFAILVLMGILLILTPWLAAEYCAQRVPELALFPSEGSRRDSLKDVTLCLTFSPLTWLFIIVWCFTVFRWMVSHVGLVYAAVSLGLVAAVGIHAQIWLFPNFAARPLRRKLIKQGIPVCLTCGYDLRGQLQPRCPECASEFDEELLANGQAAVT